MSVAEVRAAFRCEGCGKISNAKAAPRWHRRGGEHCGPFAPASVAPEGAVFAPEGAVIGPVSPQNTGGIPADPTLRYRQSTLRAYTACPRMTVLASPHTTGTIGASSDLGSAFHAVAAEILRTLKRQSATRMPHEEAIAIMREVLAKGPWVLRPEDYDRPRGEGVGLVQMVLSFIDVDWPTSRFMAIEERLSMELLCPDGEIRTFTGAPDLVMADPPDGVVIVDQKTGLAKPQTPRGHDDSQPIRGVEYLSDGGYFQLVGYGALAMHKWPRIQRATLREKNWRWAGPPREATLTRADLEHVLPFIADLMMKLDQGLREGDGSEYAEPRPGKQCGTRCPVKRSCPVPAEQRGLGAIDSDEAADEEARRWVAVTALGKEMREALKTYHEKHPERRAPVVNTELVVRWRDKPDGSGRNFGVFPPADPVDPEAVRRADEAFLANMLAEIEAREAAKAA